MAKVNMPMGTGGFTGGAHSFTSFLSGGRSLHPLQRSGQVGASGLPAVMPAGATPGTLTPPAKQTNLRYPNTLTPGAFLNSQLTAGRV
jgi:hypothetical protein